MTFQRSHIVETEPFSETFGPKAQRKRPRITASTFEELGKLSTEVTEGAEDAAEASELGVAGMIFLVLLS